MVAGSGQWVQAPGRSQSLVLRVESRAGSGASMSPSPFLCPSPALVSLGAQEQSPHGMAASRRVAWAGGEDTEAWEEVTVQTLPP